MAINNRMNPIKLMIQIRLKIIKKNSFFRRMISIEIERKINKNPSTIAKKKRNQVNDEHCDPYST